MIALKIKIDSERLIYKYDKEYDILDIYLGNTTVSFSDEIDVGVYEYYDRDTDELLGVGIEDYKSRDKDNLNKILPFRLNFEYILKNVINNQ